MRGDSTDSIEGGSLTLEDLKQKMAEFAKERDWDRFHSPRNLLLALVETKPRNPSVYLLLLLFFTSDFFFSAPFHFHSKEHNPITPKIVYVCLYLSLSTCLLCFCVVKLHHFLSVLNMTILNCFFRHPFVIFEERSNPNIPNGFLD